MTSVLDGPRRDSSGNTTTTDFSAAPRAGRPALRRKDAAAGATSPDIERHAAELYQAACEREVARTDRSFALLMIAQCVAAVAAALLLSLPEGGGHASRGGAPPTAPPAAWAAIYASGGFTALAAILGLLRAGKPDTRYVIAICQMMMSAMLIQLTGGRAETHFHIFGSLAFLAFYLDWRVLVTASVVIVADHALRGTFFPASVFGTVTPQPFRWIEFMGWIAFTDAFLILGIRQRQREIRSVAERQARQEWQNDLLQGRTRALAASEERFRQLAESLHEVLWIVDRTTNALLYVSPAYEEVWGRSRESLYANPGGLMETFHPDDRGLLRAALARQAKGEPMSAELRLLRPDGGVRWVQTRSFPMASDEGQPPRILGVTADITERKAEEERRAADQQRDRRIAVNLQAALLMPPPPGSLSGISVETLHRPARREEAQVGGDFFDVFPLERAPQNDAEPEAVSVPRAPQAGGRATAAPAPPPPLVALVVGDISGKGLAAATRTAEAKFALRAYLRDAPHADEALRRLNRYVCETQALEERRFGSFIALSVIILDPLTGEAQVAQAGAEPALVLRRAAGATPTVDVVGGPDTGGFPLGVDPAATYDAVSIRLEPGDVLLLTSDGLGEARGNCGGHTGSDPTMLGTDGIARLLTQAASRAGTGSPLRDLGGHLLAGAQEFTGGEFQDDVCLLLAGLP